MAEPCLCGATDCPRCYPGSWWHDPDTCEGDDCDCVSPDEYEPDYEPDYDERDTYLADLAADRYEQELKARW